MTGPNLWGKTAIVGIGETDYPALYRGQPGRPVDYALDAMEKAIADAGLVKAQIDGLIVSGLASYEPVMFRAGMENVRFLAHYPLGGRLCPHALAHAAMAVHHQLADYVLLFNAVGFRSAGQRFGGDMPVAGQRTSPARPSQVVAANDSLYDSAYGMTSPGAQYALLFSRWLALAGEKEENLAAIPVSTRAWAAHNRRAIFQNALTTDDYLDARYIAQPLRIFDYCLVNDGCAAYVVTSRERAADLPHPPVLVGSVASRANVRPYYASEDFWAADVRVWRYTVEKFRDPATAS